MTNMMTAAAITTPAKASEIASTETNMWTPDSQSHSTVLPQDATLNCNSLIYDM